uniref:Si:ch211-197g15.6 n=1 Tax=Sinocyclocheilus anshuiensis TaxID=1608454 RepID=A0A671SPU0_9TELE
MEESLTSDLTEEQSKQLHDLLGNVKLSLLYKASVHGYQASAFHNRCDRQGPTLLVAYNRSGYIFEFNSKNVVLPTSSRNSRLYARLETDRRDEYVQKHCNSQDKKHENTFLSGEREAAACERAIYIRGGKSFSFNAERFYGNDTVLTECEVYKVKQSNCDFFIRRDELMRMIRDHKPLVTSVSRVRILMIGPVGAGKSSFFNSINSIFTGHVTNKAMSGSAGTSLTTQFRTYPVKDGREGKPLPFVLCDTMGLEEQTGAGLDIEDISSILQGRIPDCYKFNPMVPFQPDEHKASKPASLQEKIHCVVYVIDATKSELLCKMLVIDTISGIPQMVLMTKVDESEGGVVLCLQVQEVSSRLGVPVSCVLPVKNYSQELELELNCDVLFLVALQQMLRLADDYLDDFLMLESFFQDCARLN